MPTATQEVTLRKGSKRKLPIWHTIKSSYGFFWQHQPHFRRLAALPMVISCALILLAYLLVGEEALAFLIPGSQLSPSGWAWLLQGLLSIALVPFVVAWHRLVLIGKEGLTFGKREWMFIIRILGFCVLMIVAVAAGGFLGNLCGGIFVELVLAVVGNTPPLILVLIRTVIGMIGMLAAMTPVLRLALVFPSIAIDRGTSVRDAWYMSEGQTLRLAAVLFTASIVLGIAFEIIIAAASIVLLPAAVLAVAVAIRVLAYFAVGAVGASAASLSYGFLTSADNDSTGNELRQ